MRFFYINLYTVILSFLFSQSILTAEMFDRENINPNEIVEEVNLNTNNEDVIIKFLKDALDFQLTCNRFGENYIKMAGLIVEVLEAVKNTKNKKLIKRIRKEVGLIC